MAHIEVVLVELIRLVAFDAAARDLLEAELWRPARTGTPARFG